MNLPMLDLRTRDGMPFAWNEVWQRHNVLLLLAHPDCEICRQVLADWEARAEVLTAENITPIAVFTQRPGETPPGVRVLLDPDERFARTLGVPAGTVVAADRYFEILEREDAHTLGADHAAVDALEWVKFAQRKCDECGVGTW